MGRNADRAGCDERGRTVGRGGHRVLEHLGLHQRCRHRAAGAIASSRIWRAIWVYHPQQQLIYSELKQENTALTASLPDGPHVEGNTIYTVQTLASGNWRVVGVSSVQELITDGLQEVLRISVISALFILAAMLMLSVLLSQMLSKPIQNLVSAMRSFERDADNFSYEPVTGVREVQNLSVSFEHMVHRIQKLMATVRARRSTCARRS